MVVFVVEYKKIVQAAHLFRTAVNECRRAAAGFIVVLSLRAAKIDTLGPDLISAKDANSKALAYYVAFDGIFGLLLTTKGPDRQRFPTSP